MKYLGSIDRCCPEESCSVLNEENNSTREDFERNFSTSSAIEWNCNTPVFTGSMALSVIAPEVIYTGDNAGITAIQFGLEDNEEEGDQYNITYRLTIGTHIVLYTSHNEYSTTELWNLNHYHVAAIDGTEVFREGTDGFPSDGNCSPGEGERVIYVIRRAGYIWIYLYSNSQCGIVQAGRFYDDSTASPIQLSIGLVYSRASADAMPFRLVKVNGAYLNWWKPDKWELFAHRKPYLGIEATPEQVLLHAQDTEKTGCQFPGVNAYGDAPFFLNEYKFKELSESLGVTFNGFTSSSASTDGSIYLSATEPGTEPTYTYQKAYSGTDSYWIDNGVKNYDFSSLYWNDNVYYKTLDYDGNGTPIYSDPVEELGTGIQGYYYLDADGERVFSTDIQYAQNPDTEVWDFWYITSSGGTDPVTHEVNSTEGIADISGYAHNWIDTAITNGWTDIIGNWTNRSTSSWDFTGLNNELHQAAYYDGTQYFNRQFPHTVFTYEGGEIGDYNGSQYSESSNPHEGGVYPVQIRDVQLTPCSTGIIAPPFCAAIGTGKTFTIHFPDGYAGLNYGKTFITPSTSMTDCVISRQPQYGTAAATTAGIVYTAPTTNPGIPDGNCDVFEYQLTDVFGLTSRAAVKVVIDDTSDSAEVTASENANGNIALPDSQYDYGVISRLTFNVVPLWEEYFTYAVYLFQQNYVLYHVRQSNTTTLSDFYGQVFATMEGLSPQPSATEHAISYNLTAALASIPDKTNCYNHSPAWVYYGDYREVQSVTINFTERFYNGQYTFVRNGDTHTVILDSGSAIHNGTCNSPLTESNGFSETILIELPSQYNSRTIIFSAGNGKVTAEGHVITAGEEVALCTDSCGSGEQLNRILINFITLNYVDE